MGQEWLLLFVKQECGDSHYPTVSNFAGSTLHCFPKGTRILPWAFRILQDEGVGIEVQERDGERRQDLREKDLRERSPTSGP